MKSLNFFTLLERLIGGNFIFSVCIMLAGCFFSLFEQYSFFEFNHELYGVLINSFQIIMVYLGVIELLLCLYCFFSKNFQLFIFLGFFMILLIGSLQFYGDINEVEIDASIPLFFLYVGLSHLAFGIFAKVKAERLNKTISL